MEIKLKNYSFKIDPGQNKHYWEYINATDWEPHTFTIFDYFIHKESNVLDIGAWSGVLTLYAAKIANKVHAIDPDPICFKELNTNIKLNPSIAKKIKTYNKAISDVKETLKLSARDSYGASSSSILNRKRDTENSLELETLSLIDFIESTGIQEIDFIKMDVEGAEFKILPKIGKTIEKLNHPTLYVSFHYNFLNEHIYARKVPFSFLNKLMMRLEMVFGFYVFKNSILKEINNLFSELNSYKYIYNTSGTLVPFNHLNKNPAMIKNTDLVFTNIEWK
ncbi:hypothetical protein GCM10009430_40180 [Aquimarina litoralis]|uniref:Methyltransferase FkbM domain-containing protein n=1 Tax=Aquimarina litoralis TaxID=584605 RepID=A0ABP3UDL7_9FLAO